MKRILLSILLFLSLTLAGLSQTQTLIFSPGPSDGKCALVRTDFANVPFGSTPDFTSNAWTVSGTPATLRSLICFDLTPIPANAIIINATLSLYCNLTSGYSQLQSGDNQSNLLVITQDWDKNLVTWNNQPSTTTLNSVYLPTSTGNTQNYPSIDVTVPVIQMIANPASNFGWMIKLVTEQIYRSMVFASSSHPNTNWRPKLTVTFCLLPGVAGTISGPASVCQGDIGNVYTVPPVVNATSYVWSIPPGATITNGANTNSITVSYSAGAVSGNITVYGSDLCSAGNPSPPFPVTVNASVSVAVSVSGSANNICAGTPVTFSAIAQPGGGTIAYTWKVNGIIASGGTNSTYTYVPLNGDCIVCIYSTNLPCTSGNPAMSNQVCMTVNQNLPVSVTITASANPVCAGTSVTYSAFPLNPGGSPLYQWYVNGSPFGASSSVFTYVPVNGDCITCSLNSSNSCSTGNPAMSNQVCMTVNQNLPVSVTITASANPVCAGISVTFTASPSNGGIAPGFQWKVNSLIAAGATNSTFTYTPANGDEVTCTLTSSETCTLANPVPGAPIVMIVHPLLPVSLTIAASSNPFCAGSPVTFMATPVNGGGWPGYQWYVNGIATGPNQESYLRIPAAGEVVSCVMNSGEACATGNPAASSTIVMIEHPVPVVTFTPCFDTVTSLNARPYKLKGGLPAGGQFSGPGVNSSTGVFSPSDAGTGLKTITYSNSNIYSCMTSKSKTILVIPASSFTCGNQFVDIRDDKVYATVLIGTQCWMASNLDYGTEISESQPQQDNCLPEKYSRTSATAVKFSYYQWSEMMNYDTTPGLQGLCPPGWHIPDESDWTALFNYYLGNSRAGRPLQDPYLNGFRAQQSGVDYLNTTWSFPDFAEIFWSSTQAYQVRAWSHGMNTNNHSVSLYAGLKANGFSVRCLHD